MTITYFASAGVLYAQEGGRCAKLMPSISGEFVQQDAVWVAVPVPDMAALHPTREAVPVADAADVRYGRAAQNGEWVCSGIGPACRAPLTMRKGHAPSLPQCPDCGDRNPAHRPA